MRIVVYGYRLFCNEYCELFSEEDIVGVLCNDTTDAIPEELAFKSGDMLPEYDYLVVFSKSSLCEIKEKLLNCYMIPDSKIVHCNDYLFRIKHQEKHISPDATTFIKQFVTYGKIQTILDYHGAIGEYMDHDGSELLNSRDVSIVCYEKNNGIAFDDYYSRVKGDIEVDNYQLFICLDYIFGGSADKKNFLLQNKGKFQYVILTFPYVFQSDEDVISSFKELLGDGKIILGNLYWSRIVLFERRDDNVHPNEHKMYVVTHTNWNAVLGNALYQTIYVGNEENDILCKDCVGDNIHRYNSLINELTALYYIWKNDRHRYVGLNHYRRFFKMINYDFDWKDNLPTPTYLQNILKEYDLIVARRWNHFPVKQKDSIVADIGINQYNVTANVLFEEMQKVCPESRVIFEKVLDGYAIYPCNMFYMSREKLDEYCSWMFRFLIPCCERMQVLNVGLQDPTKIRSLGFLAERLLTVWILQNKYRGCELDISLI